MIIPKAIFLNKTYIKNKDVIHRKVNIETTIVVSKVARALRCTKNHRLGRISILLTYEDFPLLTNELYPEMLNKIKDYIELAGYFTMTDKACDGIILVIDWSEVK